MAHLNAGSTDNRRGQILLIAGFTLAVIFIGLALVFNSVIYTENLATRSESTSTSKPVIHRQSVATGTERILEYVNEHNATNASSHAALKENFSEAFGAMSSQMQVGQLRDGQVVKNQRIAWYPGTWIRQTNESRNETWVLNPNETRNFTAADGSTSWTVVRDARNVRSFRIYVSNESSLAFNSLKTTDEGEGDEPFNITVTNGLTEWRMNVSDAPFSTFNATVGYTTPTGESGVCGVDSLPFVINVSEGTINGTKCPGFDFAEGFFLVPDIRYNNGESINGSYELMVNDSHVEADVNDEHYTETPDVPTTDPALYGVRVGINYENDVLRYVTDFRVVPGETND